MTRDRAAEALAGRLAAAIAAGCDPEVCAREYRRALAGGPWLDASRLLVVVQGGTGSASARVYRLRVPSAIARAWWPLSVGLLSDDLGAGERCCVVAPSVVLLLSREADRPPRWLAELVGSAAVGS